MQQEDLFEYTTGKWLYNNNLRHAERRREFNIAEFKRLAAASVNQTEKDVLSLKKLAEGGFNRSFLITMANGLRFVARIPYPVTEPKSLVVASEVATMDFLRSHGFPVPLVFGYSTTAENPAETEYIFMELVEGTNLGDVWFELDEKERTTVVTRLVQLEARLFALRFPAGGSIYYCDDVPDEHRRVLIEGSSSISAKQFCIGPDTSYRLWFGKRLNLSAERGPYRDTFEALAAGATKEIEYLEKFGKPVQPFQRLRREAYDYKAQSPLDHIANLKKYLVLAPQLVPKETPLCRPVLRHPDLQPNNVIVTSDLQIKGLIDWQHSKILPLFLQGGTPLSIQSHDLVEPLVPPENMADLDEREQREQAELYRRRHLHHEYLSKTEELNPEHHRALAEKLNKLRRELWHHASDPWEGDVVTLKADLVALTLKWKEITGEKDCPISFPEEEVRECLRLEAAQADADEQLQACEDIVGVGCEGWVPPGLFEKVKARERKFKRETFGAAETGEERGRLEENWIFDDFDEEVYT
ncbi:hypothetical protein N7532_005991 [Penicillium argentinense]|uniref:Aminoglycoside phosphotransferase domain-containing protein n=1 Tax=Penicillium argentinense TaxID=1131581 RepID=A0A9W9FEY6_9EURO|nr:uncharacterized protein N7532_005991 [Penicillium argentinense]KAJ5098990.1 hypothetical protein N7532_005991 [Penicillium argentinense]